MEHGTYKIIKRRVSYGMGYGRKLGFPTANLIPVRSQNKSPLKEGIYAGVATINRRRTRYKAGIVITRGENGRTAIETHLIGFSGDLYGKRLTISLLCYLRPFKKFKTKTLLKRQIKKDIKQIVKLDVAK